MLAVAEVCRQKPNCGSSAHIGPVVPVIVNSGDGNESGAQEGQHHREELPGMALLVEDSQLASQVHGQVPQPCERPGGVATGETLVRLLHQAWRQLAHHIPSYIIISRFGKRATKAAGVEVRARSANPILDCVSDERCQSHGRQQTQNCVMHITDVSSVAEMAYDEDEGNPQSDNRYSLEWYGVVLVGILD